MLGVLPCILGILTGIILIPNDVATLNSYITPVALYVSLPIKQIKASQSLFYLLSIFSRHFHLYFLNLAFLYQ